MVSVVRRLARRRWMAVVVGVAGLACLVPLSSSVQGWAVTRDAASTPPEPQSLLRSALASASVGYSGLAETRGSLGLPDLPRLGDVAARLGGTTRARVWWAAPDRWRVAVVDDTGEQDTYGDAGHLVTWDYEQSRLTQVTGPAAAVRLPRADDLLPPQAARRLLAGVQPTDRLEPIRPDRSVAGELAAGLRVVPADRRSTIGHIDVWVELRTGLPLQIDVVDARGATALTSRFLDLDSTPPGATVVQPPAAPGAVHDTTTAPDLVSRIEQLATYRLPNTLAGLPASAAIVGGTATYGVGLARLVVLPMTPRLAGQVLTATRTGGGARLELAHGEGLIVTGGMLTLVVARGVDAQSGGPSHAYLIAGLVTADVATAAARQLLATPPPRRPA